MYLIDVPAGKGCPALTDGVVECFLYLLSGAVELGKHPRETPVADHVDLKVAAGQSVFIPADWDASLIAQERTRLIVLRKRYEPLPARRADESVEQATFVLTDAQHTEAKPFMDNPHARLQALLPEDLRFDLAMNIFTFDPGHGLPYVETHVMEHGLLVLEGKGMYYLDGEWMEVEKDDFIWMGPYCPQSFYATGPTPAKYIYYKNVNREIPL
jgi:(S)-ureidoglycine aminohydrolase